ncbi:MAG: zinc-ribbon domain-containing protein [Candidatus Hodarchaeales archaeon]|jgi:hypothetical protein
MPFCPNCGTETGDAQFCPSCGTPQGPKAGPPGQPPYPQPVRVTSGHQYDSAICLVLCCCLSPVAALIYYLLTEHPPDTYQSQRY